MNIISKWLVALLFWSVSASAAPTLKLPLDCVIGETCFIVDLYDHGRGLDDTGTPLVTDYTGGTRSTNDYYATRFRLYSRGLATEGAKVLASADGVVTSVRDQLPTDPAAIALLGTRITRTLGNSVVIDHGNGWETQYNGLAQNHVMVHVGDRVKAGQPIAEIMGISTEVYPSMPFVVRHHGVPVDPFVGEITAWTNGQERKPLWEEDFEAVSFTQDSGLIASGFSESVPELEHVQKSILPEAYFTRDDDQMIFWSYVFGLHKGDVLNLALYNPRGEMVARHHETLSADEERYLAYVGRRAETAGMMEGVYRASVSVERDGQTLFTDLLTARVNPF